MKAPTDSGGLFRRGWNFIQGLFLLWRFRRRLELGEVLRGKRVAIIGAADSAFNTGKGEFIDGFDFVVRINKGTLLLKNDTFTKDIGRKTDILFHSFFENEKSGGGPLDFHWFDTLGVKYVVNPIATAAGDRVMLNFYKKYLSRRVCYSLSRSVYRRIRGALGAYRPTIGYCALMSILDCEFKELYITGFTFFRTPFAEGYRNEIKEVSAVRQWITEQGMHNPDLELAAFAEKYSEMNRKKIVLDDALSSIVRSI